MSDSDPTTAPATTIGRYRVVRLIAHGGMGSLYLARDPAIDRLVAIKLLKAGFDDDMARERFAREARATGGLRHPNIVTVFDVGEHHNRPFIAMEYVPGETLAQLIRRRAPLLVTEKLAILEDLCAGLHFAHRAGILHRDIKPANVILDVNGNLKILDFGLARSEDSGITQSGDQLGTLNYMSPEQVVGNRLDQRSDVYAVGAVAYELMSYKKAFSGTVPDGAMFRILHTTPEPLAAVVPGIDPEIPRMIERAMARDPDQRYQDLDALRLDLSAVRIRVYDGEPLAEPAPDEDAETRIDAPGSSRRTHFLTPTPGRRGRSLAEVIRDPSSGDRGAAPSPAGALAPASSADTAAARLTRQPSARSTFGSVDEEIEKIPSGSRASLPRRWKEFLLVGAAAAVVLLILAAAFSRMGPAGRPADSSKGESAPPSPPAAQPPAQTELKAPAASPDRAGGPDVIDQRLSSLRATALRQIVLGQRQQALDTLSAGLVLNPSDPQLQSLMQELKRTAQVAVAQGRVTAARRGATEDSSVEFRDALAREREADVLDRSGDRAPAIRSLWAAAGLYDRAARVATESRPPPPVPVPAPASKPAPAVERTEVAPAPPERPVAPSSPPLESPATLPAPAPPVAAKPEPLTPAPDNAVPDRLSIEAAIRDTLRRYADAYKSRDIAAVRRVLPSLSSQQQRNLERDLSNYRSYNVEIAGMRIFADDVTATVVCDVTRSFVTRSGIAGGNTVATTFHLRKVDGTWIIEKLESR